jgi:hypothetical protein
MKAIWDRGRIAMRPYPFTIFALFQPEQHPPKSFFSRRGAWQCARRSVMKRHKHTATLKSGFRIIPVLSFSNNIVTTGQVRTS